MRYSIKRLFTEEFKTLLFLNLLTALLCLPIVTMGPALLALNGTLVKILDDRCQLDRTREYFHLFKKKFLQGFLFELLFAAYAFLLLWSYSLGLRLENGQEVVLIMTLIMGIFAAVISVCLVFVLSSVTMPFSQALWNSVILALGRFPRAVLSAVCVYGMIYLGIALYPISVVPIVIIMISVTAVLSLGCFWPALEDLVLDPAEDEDPNTL